MVCAVLPTPRLSLRSSNARSTILHRFLSPFPKRLSTSIITLTVMQLYRHALESILSLLELQDISCASSVSRSWSAAVSTMRPINSMIERNGLQCEAEDKAFRALPPIDSIVASPLLRHLGAVHVRGKSGGLTGLTNDSLALFAQYAPSLTSLWCDLTLIPAAPLIFPMKLTSLELRLAVNTSAPDTDSVLTTLAVLPSLSRLSLRLFMFVGVDLSLLAASRSLTDLTLHMLDGSQAKLTDRQVDQIRSSFSHLKHIGDIEMSSLARLLRTPVNACWQDIGFLCADAHTGALLLSLPTLTKLSLCFLEDAPPLDFLSKLPLLTALVLYFSDDAFPDDLFVDSLLTCTGLTELDVNLLRSVDSAHLSTLFAGLPHLKTLKLCVQLDSLECLSSGSLAQSLEDLTLVRCSGQGVPLSELEVMEPVSALPVSELVHLFALKRLRSLEIDRIFE